VKTAENTTKPGLYACMHAHLAVKLTMKILSGHFTFPLVLTIKGRVLASFECYYCNRPRKNAYIIEWRFKLFFRYTRLLKTSDWHIWCGWVW